MPEMSVSSANLAGTGQLPQPNTAGRGICGLCDIDFSQQFGMASLSPFAKPMPGLFGSFANAGAFSSKSGGGGLKGVARNVMEGFAQAAGKANAEIAQNAAALGQQLAASGVQQSSVAQIQGHGLGSTGRAAAIELA